MKKISDHPQLQVYHDLLLKWQKKINLVSNNTLDNAWGRHFEDSAQLVQYIPEGAKVHVDIGSGAGFPGLVIAALRPVLEVHLIESDARKVAFLTEVIAQTGITAHLHVMRVEDATQALNLKPDVVSARALASLPDLLAYVQPWAQVNPELVCLFPKGARADEEVAAARDAGHSFELQAYPSTTDGQAQILILDSLIS